MSGIDDAATNSHPRQPAKQPVSVTRIVRPVIISNAVGKLGEPANQAGIEVGSLTFDRVDDTYNGVFLDAAVFAECEMTGDHLGVLRPKFAVDIRLEHRRNDMTIRILRQRKRWAPSKSHW